ncbi:STAS domain-containing protein [Agaribacterium haliotis]|uniref:STAS domain-containing protein n=1 Tax=Agaribacterium haliotis TaxID=2013869 RepID=UPI000BB59234|nr:STAS domain-containing protein [Agaribacterium haliotis]
MGSKLDFTLPENLTIAQAHALHDELEALIEKAEADELVLHAAKVSRADTAGMQLVLALVNASKERQMGLVWDQPSQKFLDAAKILGIETALGLH